ncbi:hypothetical protein EG68_06064 [Paragonimus skrjabini miyazakii]|uniref:Uncharacterized protein n=1 Tax=Paragonimus skrjabini miyazakii TaxID=59628 RepID=A0A8S9YXU7_9TREM|nr:hypothetical protein EG68_06064 [Paragonimus skrjabini miyazakii]
MSVSQGNKSIIHVCPNPLGLYVCLVRQRGHRLPVSVHSLSVCMSEITAPNVEYTEVHATQLILKCGQACAKLWTYTRLSPLLVHDV